MDKYRATLVFIPGGSPVYTYVPRESKGLETALEQAREHLCKLVTVTGNTKSGKTVLARKIFPKEDNIWIDGGTVSEENDLWTAIIDRLDGYSDSESTLSNDNEGGVDVSLGGELSVPMVAKAKAKIGLASKRAKGTKQSKSRSVTPRSAAIKALEATKIPLVIDDFHYLERTVQGSVVRALKGLIFDGLPVVLIAIPHRRYDAIKVERELTGRVENIGVPVWDKSELETIPKLGFGLLNVSIDAAQVDRLAAEAFGSPHLMQEFCRELCKKLHIVETGDTPIHIGAQEIGNDIFKNVAVSTGRLMFEKLAKGPRARADRIKRKLKTGNKADIYHVVLMAMAKLKPDVTTIEYEELRAAIKDLLADDLPQAHEVSRVLEFMAKISADDESSTPVIDYEKRDRKLHITDPFFAYYLRWGDIN